MNRNIRVFIGVAIIAISIVRFYNIKQQKKDREQQQQMIRDLSNQQLQERIEQEKEIVLPSLKEDLDSIQKGIEDVGRSLEEIGKDIEKMNSGK